MLDFENRGPTGSPPPTLTHIGLTEDGANSDVYTFSSLSIGTASADRYVVFAITGGSAGASRPLDTIKVDAVAQTPLALANADGGGDSMSAALVGLLIPTGTTVDLEVTFSANQNVCKVDVFTLTGGSVSGAYDADTTIETSTAATSITMTVDAPDDATVISVVNIRGSRTATWTGVTEVSDDFTDARTHTTGASDMVSGDATYDTTATFNSAQSAVGCSASFR